LLRCFSSRYKSIFDAFTRTDNRVTTKGGSFEHRAFDYVFVIFEFGKFVAAPLSKE
ncbi:MAG: hypothetical protein ACI80H_000340, partial [Pseudoalteromonas distincta]